jgi:hypothetical protein
MGGDSRQFFLLPDGTFFSNGARGQLFHGKVSLVVDAARIGRAKELVYVNHGWATDGGGNAWIVLSEINSTLSQWDGTRWAEHPFPDDIPHLRFLGLGVDTTGRVWLLPNAGKIAFFDPHTGKWQIFPDMETALLELKADAPRFAGDRPEWCAPEYSSDLKRMAFRPISWELVYYDGTQWRRWKRGAIDGGTNPNVFTMGQPFFDKSDHLCICIDQGTWRLNDDGHWAPAQIQPKYPDERGRRPRAAWDKEAPDGWPLSAPDSVAADNQGASWVTIEGKLYRFWCGHAAGVFSDDEPDPFSDGRKLVSAWVDPQGNAFVKTAFDIYVMIRSKMLIPQPVVSLTKTSPDSVAAKVETDPASKLALYWQLDEAPWQPVGDAPLSFDHLAEGKHTLKALAMDEHLQSGPTAVSTLDIKINPKDKLDILIAKLASDSNTECQSALLALARQPDDALPELKAARESATAHQQWWIDATIREIERRAAESGAHAPVAQPQVSPR